VINIQKLAELKAWYRLNGDTSADGTTVKNMVGDDYATIEGSAEYLKNMFNMYSMRFRSLAQYVLTGDDTNLVITDINIAVAGWCMIAYGSISGSSSPSLGGQLLTIEDRFYFGNDGTNWYAGYGTKSITSTVLSDEDDHVFELNAGILYVDGVFVVDASQGTYVQNVTSRFTLMGLNGTGVATNLNAGRFYFCKLYDETNTLRGDYTSTVDGVIYDAISDTLYDTSPNTVNSYTVQESSSYTIEDVEYSTPDVLRSISIDAGRHLDTGVVIDDNTEWEIRGKFTALGLYVMGARTGTDRAYFLGQNAGQFIYGWGAATANMGLASDTNVHTWTKIGNDHSIDGTTTVTLAGGNANTRTGWLFTTNVDGATTFSNYFDLQYAKIWTSSILVRDYTPTRDGGLYDAVNDTTTYTNTGRYPMEGTRIGVNPPPA
jgi:hypothetical protein